METSRKNQMRLNIHILFLFPSVLDSDNFNKSKSNSLSSQYSNSHVPDPYFANKERILFPIKIKRLVSCPVKVMYKSLGKSRYYPGKKLYHATAFLAVDKLKRITFQIGLHVPSGHYVRMNIAKPYLLEMIKYHLKLRPIPSIKSGNHKLWFPNKEIAAQIQNTDLENIDPDFLLDEYLAAVTNMEKVEYRSCDKFKEEAHQQYKNLLEMQNKVYIWAYIQKCKQKNIKVDMSEFELFLKGHEIPLHLSIA